MNTRCRMPGCAEHRAGDGLFCAAHDLGPVELVGGPWDGERKEPLCDPLYVGTSPIDGVFGWSREPPADQCLGLYRLSIPSRDLPRGEDGARVLELDASRARFVWIPAGWRPPDLAPA